MVPIGFALSWLGYAVAFWGHALVKGYNISFAQVVSPMDHTFWKKGTWPPPMAVNTVIFPNGKSSDNATGATKSSSGTNTTAATTAQNRVDRVTGSNGPPNLHTGGPNPHVR